MELILASGSPRRRELFALMGLRYRVCPSNADETLAPCAPAEMVQSLALRKARSVLCDFPAACVVGADTVVYLDGAIIGKPKDAEDAARILRTLSGRTHTVYTGVAVITADTEEIFFETTRVTFADLRDAEIAAYIASGEPMDKAGAYGVQGIGSVFVTKVEGCYFNVIGMPVPALYRALENVGIYPAWRNRP